ncbi:alpha/beta fold hydrolase [Hymenobacter norwichensis]|uniref:alpha/beta fold hydrolase n=1 Tax=Hymenobacter norwichensis TaxID=223903 RepID=UPI0003B4BE7B|nr:alpha/beta hydrolase [Hymenobacter norwichensis]
MATDILQRNNVQVVGHGPRTLLFVNGFGCDQTMWRYITPAFSEHFKLVLFDHVGGSLSDANAYEPLKYATLHGYAQDVLAICRQLDLSQVTLIGHSVGAMIGVLAAIAEPSRFQQLLLLCPSPCYLNEPGYYGGFDKADIVAMLEFMQTDYVGWADTFAPLIMGNPEQPSLADELSHSFCQTLPAIAQQFARVTFLSDNRLDIRQLQTPCVLLQSAKDLIAPLEVGDYLKKHIPGSILITLPVAGHCPQLSAPMETLLAMEACLAA